MANGKRIKAIDAELHLPEAIIQRIQSFLNRKQAASTVILSKSWYTAWLTRPVLDFDERDFPSDVEFLNFVTRSMERYRELNLNIERFALWMNVVDKYTSSLATELIVKAVKMGAIEFNLEFNPPISKYILPKDLFESEYLVGLSAVGCRIYGLEVKCARLTSLSLYQAHIRDDMIKNIILKCPRLENLFLSECEGFKEVNVGRMIKLKKFSVTRQVKRPTRRRIPLIEFEEQSVGYLTNVSGFCTLSCLLLERVDIPKMLFCDFSSKFPFVKDLTVRYCDGCVMFDMSSSSINYISLAHTKRLEIQLDVPNIQKFKFSGTNTPSLSVVSASKKWESDITLSCWSNLGVSWLLELNEFLTNLSTSKITLFIELLGGTNIGRLPEIQYFCRPEVENLTLGVHSLTSDCVALLDGIYWSFRPKIITQCLYTVYECRKSHTTGHQQPQYRLASNEMLLVLSKKLMNHKSSSFSRNGWHLIKEVNVEILEDMHMEWRPLPWKTLFDALLSLEKEMQIRFPIEMGITLKYLYLPWSAYRVLFCIYRLFCHVKMRN